MGFLYESTLPALCHGHLQNTLSPEATSTFAALAEKVSINAFNPNLTEFAHTYLDVFNQGFHYAFAASIVALMISLTIYIKNKKSLPDPAAKKIASGNKEEITMDKKEIKQRIYALAAVMGVVVFF